MPHRELLEDARAHYPDAGTLRVNVTPELLLPAQEHLVGVNRFDDPDGRVAVRYTATQLITCLKETMARLRPSPDAEARLAAIIGVDDDDTAWDAADTAAVGDWLASQRVGTVRVLDTGTFLEIENGVLLVELDKHDRVRAAVVALDPAGRLDTGLIRVGGPLGRAISQAVGSAVREWIPTALGIGYHSRLATNEACWAIWESTNVHVTSVQLSPEDAQHRDTVREVAALFEIALPADWDSDPTD